MYILLALILIIILLNYVNVMSPLGEFSSTTFQNPNCPQPPIRLFNVTGIMVQGGSCEVDSCTVQVMPPPIATRAAYSCEVSTEGPKFQIARQTKHMTIVGEFLVYFIKQYIELPYIYICAFEMHVTNILNTNINK